CVQLFLPTLQEQISDLPSIIALYINKLNTSLGKQIIGFKPEALELMKKFKCENNLEQLYRVLRELVILTEEPYISEDLLKKILSRHRLIKKTITSTNPSIPLNKTVDEINCYIILDILEEEVQHNERTAKQLAISRSSLWRKINSPPTT